MKKFKTPYRFMCYYNIDLWNTIFKFNKNVRFYKYIAYSKIPSLRFKYSYKIKVNMEVLSTRVKRVYGGSKYSKKLVNKRIFSYFYGRMTSNYIKQFFYSIKGKASNNRSGINWIFTKLEYRLDVFVYRAGWFSDILIPNQLSRHGHFIVDGKLVAKPFGKIELKVGQIVSIPFCFFKIKRIFFQVKNKSYVYPPNYMLISHYFPFSVVLEPFKHKNLVSWPTDHSLGFDPYNYRYLLCVSILYINTIFINLYNLYWDYNFD